MFGVFSLYAEELAELLGCDVEALEARIIAMRACGLSDEVEKARNRAFLSVAHSLLSGPYADAFVERSLGALQTWRQKEGI